MVVVAFLTICVVSFIATFLLAKWFPPLRRKLRRDRGKPLKVNALIVFLYNALCVAGAVTLICACSLWNGIYGREIIRLAWWHLAFAIVVSIASYVTSSIVDGLVKMHLQYEDVGDSIVRSHLVYLFSSVSMGLLLLTHLRHPATSLCR
jgi:hypothetical protein